MSHILDVLTEDLEQARLDQKETREMQASQDLPVNIGFIAERLL